jgi:hypothetical protein
VEAYPAQFNAPLVKFVFYGRNARQTKKPSGLGRKAFSYADFSTARHPTQHPLQCWARLPVLRLPLG